MGTPTGSLEKAPFEVFPVNSVYIQVEQHFQSIIMSWVKDSVKVGLAGLTPLEAARGAMFLPVFQDMSDPLKEEPQEIEITSPEDIPMMSVSN